MATPPQVRPSGVSRPGWPFRMPVTGSISWWTELRYPGMAWATASQASSGWLSRTARPGLPVRYQNVGDLRVQHGQQDAPADVRGCAPVLGFWASNADLGHGHLCSHAMTHPVINEGNCPSEDAI